MRGKSKAIVPEIQPASDGQAREAAEVGVWLGRRQAFAMMAGRCSASDAECLRDIRAHKRYRAFNMAWDQFCTEHLGINRATADRVIRQLDEFGPEFFTLAQLTHITPAEFRQLQPAVRGHALLHAGEAIPIEAQNGPRLAAALDELRRTLPAQPKEPSAGVAAPAAADAAAPDGATAADDASAAIARAERSLNAALEELERLQKIQLDVAVRMRLQSLTGYAAHKFNLLQLAIQF